MASKLNPYITFGGNAAEAMAFYASVLGGEVETSLFRDFGTDMVGVMHANLVTTLGYTIMASDAFEVPTGGTDTNVQLSLSGEDAELRDYFAGLSEDGQVITPLEKQMWGDEYGSFVDKFGVTWMVNVVAPKE